MSKRLKKVFTFAALLLLLVVAATVWHNNNAYAKNQANTIKSPAELMAKYSHKTKQNSTETIRRSRLPQMNIISEAANVLNLLPINIMDEMKKGKTLEQVAQEKGLSKDQFLTKLTDFENQTVAVASKAGTITKDHEKALKEGQKDRLTKSLSVKAVNVNDHKAMDMGN
jgi:hypothetical protein